MVLWGIFISAFLIGFSGAMMPGPMLGVTIDGSLKKGWTAGPLTVLGHGILELILIIIMIFGLKDFFSKATVAGFIGLFGGAFLAWMGYGMIKSGINKSVSLESQRAGNSAGVRNLALAGALVSATNPYFILWWASTGMESIRQSYTSGLIGVLFFFIGHILSDFVWYSAISIAFSRGKKLISGTVYRWIILLLGIFIVAFSIYFIASGWKILRIS
ncbi:MULTISPECIES: LysE family transporter [Eubacteriales]|uniref:Threonine efflux system n=2 Tax=Eubacteriales TaxID=186802 RepID=A0A2T0AVB4_9CLOT|nr:MULTISPECIES: LysE family transporter [Eubacteriales]AEV66964.1 putative threonine efflux protein [Acetivibrio clariflavus DSM 19732]PRR74530.1 threonine efflux system [Clostridium thermopalmarium DSM 5974]PVZ15870.1 threonine/homoserine/homoserine lactone efflux protein [Clostridium thermopalmarium DSM 5974]